MYNACKIHNKFISYIIVLVLLSLFVNCFSGIFADAYDLDLPETVLLEEGVFDCPRLSNEELASAVDLSTSNYFPPIRYQKGNSCTPWATVYYQYTYEVARKYGFDAKHDDSKVFSPKYVWNYCNYGGEVGVHYGTCYEFLERNGCISWSAFPHNTTSYNWYQVGNDAEKLNNLYSALNYKISKWGCRFFYNQSSTQTIITSPNSYYLTSMKERLNSGQMIPLFLAKIPMVTLN